jgi:hypothetical protein
LNNEEKRGGREITKITLKRIVRPENEQTIKGNRR